MWLNLRVFNYHLQAGNKAWWHVSWTRNSYHDGNPKHIQLYQLFWWEDDERSL